MFGSGSPNYFALTLKLFIEKFMLLLFLYVTTGSQVALFCIYTLVRLQLAQEDADNAH